MVIAAWLALRAGFSAAAREPRRRAVGRDLHADEARRVRGRRGLDRRQEGRERGVRFQLLLDRGELHELLRELVGVERVERALVLELRREQHQEGIEVLGDALARRLAGRGGGGGGGARAGDRVGHGGLL